MNPPKYAKFVDTGTEMILNVNTARYYREYGDWECGYRIVNGKVYAVSLSNPKMAWIEGAELVEISLDEWRLGNGYKVKGIVLDGFNKRRKHG